MRGIVLSTSGSSESKWYILHDTKISHAGATLETVKAAYADSAHLVVVVAGLRATVTEGVPLAQNGPINIDPRLLACQPCRCHSPLTKHEPPSGNNLPVRFCNLVSPSDKQQKREKMVVSRVASELWVGVSSRVEPWEPNHSGSFAPSLIMPALLIDFALTTPAEPPPISDPTWNVG